MLVGDGPSHFWRIAVEVMPWTFESVMERYDVRREGGRWFVGEGAREAPAYEIKGAGWWGLRVDDLPIRSGPLAGRDDLPQSVESGRLGHHLEHGERTNRDVPGWRRGRYRSPALLLKTVSFDQKR